MNYFEYEKRKREIKDKNLSSEEYEKAIKRITEELEKEQEENQKSNEQRN